MQISKYDQVFCSNFDSFLKSYMVLNVQQSTRLSCFNGETKLFQVKLVLGQVQESDLVQVLTILQSGYGILGSKVGLVGLCYDI